MPEIRDLLTSGTFWTAVGSIAAALTIIIRSFWFLASAFLKKVRLCLATKTKDFSVSLGPYDEQFTSITEHARFYCLLVRYGTDQYIRDIANEQDKYDGQLQNKVILLSIGKDKNNQAILELKLPIHRRIGTQFKCFVEADQSTQLNQLRTLLEAQTQIQPDKTSDEFSQFPNRLFFLVKRFGKVKTVEGFKNNICLPE